MRESIDAKEEKQITQVDKKGQTGESGVSEKTSES